jgi:hypothetical protein
VTALRIVSLGFEPAVVDAIDISRSQSGSSCTTKRNSECRLQPKPLWRDKDEYLKDIKGYRIHKQGRRQCGNGRKYRDPPHFSSCSSATSTIDASHIVLAASRLMMISIISPPTLAQVIEAGIPAELPSFMPQRVMIIDNATNAAVHAQKSIRSGNWFANSVMFIGRMDRWPPLLGAGRAVLSWGELLPVFNFIQTPSGEKRKFVPNLSRYRKLAGRRFNFCFSDPCRKRRLLNSRGAGRGEGECYAYSAIA